jgi:hypothetical protein
MTLMKKFSFRFATLMLLICLTGFAAQAQKAVDFKTKTSTNTVERTAMLDLLRAKMKTEFQQEFKYVVNHFKVSGNFAWLKADAQRKDGKEISFNEEEAYDCCHVECLFKKVNGKWTISEYGAFSTDVWYEGIQEGSGAPAAIF